MPRGGRPSEGDLAIESTVLIQLLAAHPVRLTLEELVRELEGEAAFEADDAVRRAVRDLGGTGLVHVHGEFVSPTRAALRGRELLEH